MLAQKLLAKFAGSGSIGTQLKNDQKTKPTNLRLRLLSTTKREICNLQDTVRGTPKPGVPESVSVRAFACLLWSVSRSRPFCLAAGAGTGAIALKAKILFVALIALIVAAVKLPAQNTNTGNTPTWENTQPVTTSGTNATGTSITSAGDIFDRVAAEQATTNKPRPLTDAEVGLVPYSPGSTNAAVTNTSRAGEFDDLIPHATNGAASNTFEETKAKAEKGDAAAQFSLAGFYYNATNYTEAVKWFQKCAEQNYAPAQYNLGVFYSLGLGGDTNYAEAVKWYGKAAKQDYAPAQGRLGLFFYEGLGVSRDYSQAVMWLQKAAEQGDLVGQAILGECYKEGTGLPKNDIEAYKWLSLAAAHEWRNSFSDNDADSIRKLELSDLNVCQARMSREEIIEAQHLASEFKPKTSSGSDSSSSPDNPTATGTGFFITDDGYLISNCHVVKDAAQVRLLTRAGTIPAKVVQVD